MASLLLLHTCESDGTARANASYLVRIGAEPHWVFDPRFGVDEAIHLVPYTRAGKALRNLDGGVETNRREQDNAEGVDVIQVEIVGYAAQVGGYDDAWYRNLRTFLLEVCAATGVPYVFPRRFAVRYGDDGVRYTPDEWNDPELVGIVGHCHAPENDHWDPGDLDLSRLTNSPEDDDMTPEQLAHALGGTLNLAGQVSVSLIGDDLQSSDLYTVAQALTFIHQELKMARLADSLSDRSRDQAAFADAVRAMFVLRLSL